VIDGIYHVAYLTDDIAAAIQFYQNVFGAQLIKESLSDRGTKMAFLHVGQQDVELLEPADKSELGGQKGLILDHVGYVVPDIRAAMAELRGRGIAFETEEPLTSPHMVVQVVYLTRESARGTVIHLVQV
jgi:catechol 2,3-dioxygenase-like lactoylglutathione lyase family enzyme